MTNIIDKDLKSALDQLEALKSSTASSFEILEANLNQFRKLFDAVKAQKEVPTVTIDFNCPDSLALKADILTNLLKHAFKNHLDLKNILLHKTSLFKLQEEFNVGYLFSTNNSSLYFTNSFDAKSDHSFKFSDADCSGYGADLIFSHDSLILKIGCFGQNIDMITVAKISRQSTQK